MTARCRAPIFGGDMFGSFDIHATGAPALDAQADFRRARRAHRVARTVGGFRQRRVGRHPLALSDPLAESGASRRLQVVRLDSIVGTLEPSVQFDARFRPGSEALRRRWERIAFAYRKGDALPPIDLVKQPDGYYVRDGRHRVSVARALGHADIDAWVTARSGKPGCLAC